MCCGRNFGQRLLPAVEGTCCCRRVLGRKPLLLICSQAASMPFCRVDLSFSRAVEAACPLQVLPEAKVTCDEQQSTATGTTVAAVSDVMSLCVGRCELCH